MTDFQTLADELGLDLADFMELTQLFVETTLADIERLQSALEARDAGAVTEVAHAIKGASGNLGFRAIYTLTQVAEKKAREGNLDVLGSLGKRLTQELESIRNAL